MSQEPGLRDRKKARTRHRLADVAAGLFAAQGYDAVSMTDVARAAEVSDQTVYNYFPAKQDLVLDRADEIRDRYGDVVRQRPAGTSPAQALHPLVRADIDRYRHARPDLVRGEFPAQCVASPVLRRFALEAREQQARVVADAITGTDPRVPPVVARAHAAALVAVIAEIIDQIGESVLRDRPGAAAAAEMTRAAETGFAYLDREFRHAVPSLPPAGATP